MAQIYYFCLNYFGRAHFLQHQKGQRKKWSVCVQSLFSASAKPASEKELQQCTPPSRKRVSKMKHSHQQKCKINF